MAAAQHGMFIVVVKVETFTMFEHRLEPASVAGAAHRHRQARFDRAQYGDEAALDLVALGNVLNKVLLDGLAGT